MNIKESFAAFIDAVQSLVYDEDKAARAFHRDLRGRPDEVKFHKIETLIGTERAARLFLAIRAECNAYTVEDEFVLAADILSALENGVPPALLIAAAENGPDALRALLNGYMRELLHALTALCEQLEKGMRALEEYAAEFKTEPRPDIFREWPRPARRAHARGLSPPLRRYWVNYKARDRLPHAARKSATGGKGNAKTE